MIGTTSAHDRHNFPEIVAMTDPGGHDFREVVPVAGPVDRGSVGPVGQHVGMSENPFALLDRAAAVADSVIAGVKSDQLDNPSPCTEWSVRDVINHLVTGNLVFISMLTGAPRPDRSVDHLGDDPLAAFRDTFRTLRAAFAGEGVLDKTYPTPFGSGPGSLLVEMRTTEMTIHSWDIARGSGRSTDLDPELAESRLASLRAALTGDRSGSPFAAERAAPPGASAADRLAAFAGRAV
jgi:uncharacterized protein (TIGR03086 family)